MRRYVDSVISLFNVWEAKIHTFSNKYGGDGHMGSITKCERDPLDLRGIMSNGVRRDTSGSGGIANPK